MATSLVTDPHDSPAPPTRVGEDRAAPAKVLLDEAKTVTELIRAALDDASCQLLWSERSYGRVFSLAALSHECVVLEQIASGVRQNYPPSIMALLSRHHLETWLTGIYLLTGGEAALEAFLGDSRRSYEALRQKMEELRNAGVSLDVELPPLEDFEWEARRWSYERVAQEVDRLGSESGLFHNALVMYQVGYRALSGAHGAHPTHRLFDTYVATGRTFARVLPQSEATLLPGELLQVSLFLTGIHGMFALSERGCRTDEIARVVDALRLPDDALESTEQPTVQQEEAT
ncbi:MAG: hypothetical protein M1134_03785 [Actinobacteria bacterium]|jgi:hypothetical protein|nr:hypothetical protein [Actinomycetota bacterium]MCL5444882.1 hypothetical protein [Actinomycetota bacterium]